MTSGDVQQADVSLTAIRQLYGSELCAVCVILCNHVNMLNVRCLQMLASDHEMLKQKLRDKIFIDACYLRGVEPVRQSLDMHFFV